MVNAYDDRDGHIWIDGDLVEWRNANVHILTHALHYGSAVFEGERAYNGKIFKSKHQTHHIFQYGDMLFMDQFTSLHRRTPVMGPRLLWRVASDYKRLWN